MSRKALAIVSLAFVGCAARPPAAPASRSLDEGERWFEALLHGSPETRGETLHAADDIPLGVVRRALMERSADDDPLTRHVAALGLRPRGDLDRVLRVPGVQPVTHERDPALVVVLLTDRPCREPSVVYEPIALTRAPCAHAERRESGIDSDGVR